jgi:hypothetical protein
MAREAKTSRLSESPEKREPSSSALRVKIASPVRIDSAIGLSALSGKVS